MAEENTASVAIKLLHKLHASAGESRIQKLCEKDIKCGTFRLTGESSRLFVNGDEFP